MYISVVMIRVDDIERAIDFYTHQLGWEKTMDAPMGEGSRWVTVAPKGSQAAFSLMPRSAENAESSDVILEVEDVFKTHEQLSKRGVNFTEQPRKEPWGGWAMFKDSEGNELGVHSSP